MRAIWERFRLSPIGAFILAFIERFNESRLTLLAAGLAYYAAFSLGPLLLILAGWLGLFLRNRPELASQYQAVLADLLEQILPLQSNSAELVSQSFNVIVEQLSQGAILRSTISFLVLLWASSNFFTVLQLALEVIFDVEDSRGYWRKRLIAILLVASVALVIAIEIVGVLIASAFNQLNEVFILALNDLNIVLPNLSPNWTQGLFLEILRIALAIIVFSLCYRYLPRQNSTWLGAILGAIVSTASLRGMQFLFPKFFNPEQFSVVYGIITSLLVILLWLYLALLVFLLSAVLVAEISERRLLEPKQNQT